MKTKSFMKEMKVALAEVVREVGMVIHHVEEASEVTIMPAMAQDHWVAAQEAADNATVMLDNIADQIAKARVEGERRQKQYLRTATGQKNGKGGRV